MTKKPFSIPAWVSTKLVAMLVSMRRGSKVAVMIAVDLISLPVCFFIAVLLRVGSLEDAVAIGVVPCILIGVFTVPVFAATGLYGAVIRFIDQHLLAATGAGLAVVVSIAYLASAFYDFRGLPQNALMIYWFTAFSYVVTSRLLARVLLRSGNAVESRSPGHVAAIYGAGEAGVKLATAMRASGKYRPVCFFDDRHALDNRNVAGLRVVHSERLVETVSQRHVDLIVIAIPSATPEQRRQIMYRASKSLASVKILNSLMELADEEISVQAIREIKVDDLLGREPIAPRADLFEKCVRGQGVLVTGAGGSIGSELCRQIMTLSPRELHLVDHSELALYNISQELLLRFPGTVVHAHLGSVCDAGFVNRILQESTIDTVYHAAAYKHVPLVEANMAEGVRNNILGADVVVKAAERAGVRTCVLISTDKAVRPTSIMGASKRVAELIFQAAALRSAGSTKFCMVRFGNVLGSSGSVVPLFQSQIERGGPITVTHPEIVRYFMSISEAAQLVMQAGAMAVGGDVFVMNMGEPVKIVYLARTMIAMCGLTEKSPENPGGDIEIQFVGLRQGEKLYEELFAGNNAIPSKHPRIMTTTEYVVEPEVLEKQVAYLMVACATNDAAMIRFLMQKLVREYLPANADGTPRFVERRVASLPVEEWHLEDKVRMRG